MVTSVESSFGVFSPTVVVFEDGRAAVACGRGNAWSSISCSVSARRLQERNLLVKERAGKFGAPALNAIDDMVRRSESVVTETGCL